MENTIYLDMDGVVFNTIKTIVDMYNDDFRYYKDFEVVHWWDVNTWGFTECELASHECIWAYFNQPRFFEKYLELMPYAEEVLKRLAKSYEIIFVSMGEYANLALKRCWIEKYMPDCSFIEVDIDEPDKSMVDMSGGIFIDDRSDNLRSSNAYKLYCFGDRYPWNKDWQGKRLANWTDVYCEFLKN